MNGHLARPWSIIWFERLFLTGIAFRALNLFLGWEAFTFEFRMNNPDLPQRITLAGAIVGMLIPLALSWLAARRRKRFAAWAIALWVAMGIAFFVAEQVETGLVLGPVTVLAIFFLLLVSGAAVLLFLPESRRWFAGSPGRSDLELDFS